MELVQVDDRASAQEEIHTKYVRLVRRRLNGKTRYWAQLVCQGLPYRKEKNAIGTGRVGIDPGPRLFGIGGIHWGALVDLATPLKATQKEIRRLQRQIDRQRRANNPDNYLPEGRIRPGLKKWHKTVVLERWNVASGLGPS